MFGILLLRIMVASQPVEVGSVSVDLFLVFVQSEGIKFHFTQRNSATIVFALLFLIFVILVVQKLLLG